MISIPQCRTLGLSSYYEKMSQTGTYHWTWVALFWVSTFFFHRFAIFFLWYFFDKCIKNCIKSKELGSFWKHFWRVNKYFSKNHKKWSFFQKKRGEIGGVELQRENTKFKKSEGVPCRRKKKERWKKIVLHKFFQDMFRNFFPDHPSPMIYTSIGM